MLWPPVSKRKGRPFESTHKLSNCKPTTSQLASKTSIRKSSVAAFRNFSSSKYLVSESVCMCSPTLIYL